MKENRPVTNLALDRIEQISYADVPYIENNNIDFNEYFEDIIGVSVLKKDVEQLILEIDNNLFPYVETKPLHGSQKVKERGAKTAIIELNLIINHELENFLLAYIDKIRIAAPVHFRKKILDRIKEAVERNS